MDFAEKEGLLRAYRTSLCHSLVLTKTKTDGKIFTGCAINLPKGNKEKAEHNANWPKDQVNPTSINCNDKKKY